MVNHPTRVSLLVRLKDGGDEKDWKEFTDFYWRLIRSWAKLFGCPDPMIEDIYQNTMVAVMGALPTFEHSGQPGCFRSWLKTIVQRRVYDYFRWEMKHAEKPDKEESSSRWKLPGKEYGEQSDPDSEREANMDRIWLRQLLDLAMEAAEKRVKPEKFESFRRYVIYQEPVSQVSKDMGIRAGTIFQHKSSFLDILREEFVRLLEGLHDLGPAMANDAHSRKQLKIVLEDYIQTRKELRNTIVVQNQPKKDLRAAEAIKKIMANNPPPSPGRYLLLLRPDKTSEWIAAEDGLTIGSDDSSDIVLNAESVSGLHASIHLDGDNFVAKDEDSTNGLFLNERRIGEWPLQTGDWVQITDFCLVYLDTIQ